MFLYRQYSVLYVTRRLSIYVNHDTDHYFLSMFKLKQSADLLTKHN